MDLVDELFVVSLSIVDGEMCYSIGVNMTHEFLAIPNGAMQALSASP